MFTVCSETHTPQNAFHHLGLLVFVVLRAQNVLFQRGRVRKVGRADKNICLPKLGNVGFPKSHYLKFACFLAVFRIEMLENN